MDSLEDDRDYVPESLSSYLKEADKNLAEATALLNSQFKQQRSITPASHYACDDDTPASLNPAAALTTPQAKALAFEGTSPPRSTSRTPPIGKNLFEEDFSSPLAKIDEMLKQVSGEENEAANVFDEATHRIEKGYHDAADDTGPSLNISPSRHDDKSVSKSVGKQEVSPPRASVKLLANTDQTPLESSSENIALLKDSPVPKENPVESPMSPRSSPMSDFVSGFQPEAEPSSAKVDNSTPFEPADRNVSMNSLHMNNVVVSKLSPIKCSSPEANDIETLEVKLDTSQPTPRSIHRDPPVSKENTVESPSSPSRSSASKPDQLSPGAINAMSRARERVRQRKLAEQQRQLQLESAHVKENEVPTRTSRQKSLGMLRQKQMQMDAHKKAESERRQIVAEKIRSNSSKGAKYNHSKNSPKSVSSKQSSVYEPRPTISSAKKIRSKLPPSRSVTPRRSDSSKPKESKSFYYASTPIRKKPEPTLAESAQCFGKGLRGNAADPPKNTTYRPRVTTPKPFKFHESRSSRHSRVADEGKKLRKPETIAESMNDFGRHLRKIPLAPKRDPSKPTVPISPNFTPMERRERGPRKTQTMAESTRDFGRHLREIPVATNRDFSKPTVPISPKFTKITKREKVKSTAEKEQEIVDYYNSHRFKAAPIMTESRSSLPKNVPQRKLTVPKPFKFNKTSRSSPEKTNVEDVNQPTRFRARPMPKSFAARNSCAKESNVYTRDRASKTFNSRRT